jgi:C4-dicarboxylate-specific signal transduction histidine kinase
MAELVHDVPEPGDESIPETIRAATGHLGRSLELLDRLLRQVPRGAEAGPVSLAESLAFAKDLHRAHRTSIQLDVDAALSPSLPAIRGVEQELEQILLNLLVNSLEAMGERIDGVIRLRSETVDGGVRLMIEDDGPGVPPELGERVFEPYVTGRPGAKAGLGLTAARALATRWGGTLDWEPMGRAGARFALRLPGWK